MRRGRKPKNAIHEWRGEPGTIYPEGDFDRYMKPAAEQLERGKRRRRIEDIREASRIEEDFFSEVWE